MRSTIALAGLLASLALANPEPQTPAQTTAAFEAYESYEAALRTDPALVSLSSVYRTDAAGRSSYLSAYRSILSAYAAGETIDGSDLTAFPTNVQSVLQSAVSAANAIGTSNGFSSGGFPPPTTPITRPTAAPTPVSTSSHDAAPTGKAVALGGVLVGGLVAVAAVL